MTPEPNTLVTGDGHWPGHAGHAGIGGIGGIGVADRWADLAIATWSTEWNYGNGWEQPLPGTHGIKPDAKHTATTGCSGSLARAPAKY